ncbi:MAG: ParA family protein, partial [Solimonas sp.]
MHSVALYNLKGGVGKTAAAVNLAYLAAAHGVETLLWDLDPQGASSWYFRSKPKEMDPKKLVQGTT